MPIRLLLSLLTALAAPLAAIAAAPEEIASKVAASVKLAPTWERIEVQRAKADDYALIVWYKKSPGTLAAVEQDTTIVARALLRELVKVGTLPRASPLYVVVRGRKAETGETGKQLVRLYGVSRYDSVSDQIAFERNK
jgi:hypothetical protein